MMMVKSSSTGKITGKITGSVTNPTLDDIKTIFELNKLLKMDGNPDCPYCHGSPGRGGCGQCGGTYDGNDD